MRKRCTSKGSVVLVLLVALAAGCSSGGDPQSIAQCNQLVKAFCERVGACHVQNGNVSESESPALVAECRNNGDTYQHCDTAIGISNDYDACVSAIQGTDCSSIVRDYFDKKHRLPVVCSGVVTYEK